MPQRPVPPAPLFDDVVASLEPAAAIVLRLRTATPVVGGGYRARELDDVDTVRVPGIRGQLRFWWRAVYGASFPNAAALYKAESALWGGTAGDARRSSAVVRVVDATRSNQVSNEVGLGTPRRYALFATQLGGAQLRRLGDTFTLRVERGGASDEQWAQVDAALSAFLLFGGIGSRTRRGMGALAPQDDQATADYFASAMGRVRAAVAAAHPVAARPFPTLAGGTLLWLPDAADEVEVFSTMRQGMPRALGLDPWHARERVDGSRRAGQSRWPEPAALRRALARPGIVFTHVTAPPGAPLRYPRALFGLPIKVQWQRRGRGQNAAPYREPDDCFVVPGDQDIKRLASSVIVKPVWAKDKLRPLWLVLRRAAPPFSVGVSVDENAPRQGLASFPADARDFPFPRAEGESTALADTLERWLVHHGCFRHREVLP